VLTGGDLGITGEDFRRFNGQKRLTIGKGVLDHWYEKICRFRDRRPESGERYHE
jgi:hypothetical protein